MVNYLIGWRSLEIRVNGIKSLGLVGCGLGSMNSQPEVSFMEG